MIWAVARETPRAAMVRRLERATGDMEVDKCETKGEEGSGCGTRAGLSPENKHCEWSDLEYSVASILHGPCTDHVFDLRVAPIVAFPPSRLNMAKTATGLIFLFFSLVARSLLFRNKNQICHQSRQYQNGAPKERLLYSTVSMYSSLITFYRCGGQAKA